MTRDGAHILCVDDSRVIRGLLAKRLGPLCSRLTLCSSAAEARGVLDREPVDVAVLDVELSDATGFDLCAWIKQHPAAGETVVVFLSMRDDAESKVLGLNRGAVDFITKPFHPAELTARITGALRQKHTCDMLHRLAEADPLSGLGNRRRFDRVAPAEITRCAAQGHAVALTLIDIDRFKQINDACGHPVGDRVLSIIAGILESTLPETSLLCRLGGDEMVALESGVELEVAQARAEQASERVRTSSEIAALTGDCVTLSVGVAGAASGRSIELADLLRAADEALYEAKRGGRDRVVARAVGELPGHGVAAA